MNKELIYNKYLNRKYFITGPGGTGKSYLIKKITKHAEDNKKIKVCKNLTGYSAILLKCKATTLHSFAGIGLANKPINDVVRYVLDNKNKAKKLEKHIKGGTTPKLISIKAQQCFSFKAELEKVILSVQEK